ncbi:hypothetical protein QFZ82_003768 [Streptomyces sp. V4I23]|uniref:hypothetical protein n=1 Tax=Streptomyces sp. V4I23 TaxID=3042282 RepID=UPI002789DD09|nr:hypothetical protein [Streptomyces sp. V4I23]MDQ1009283.1 hypothetical protein [Streptomyces sp. V4I23]
MRRPRGTRGGGSTGFDNFARKVRDASLPYGHRVVSLRSCAQLYRPIGFQATVSYLEAKAGPFRHDEAALLRALGVIRASRSLWQADVRAYAEKRGEAKRRGLRSPRPGEANPLVPAYWYGAPREAAPHALDHWRRGLRRGGTQREGLVGEMDRLAAECVAAGGELDPHRRAVLASCVERLEPRTLPAAWHDDRDGYFAARSLLFVAELMRTAGDPPGAASP